MHSKFADIHPNAKIGENVEISNFVTIYDDVEIGDGTWIGPNVTIFPGARIGKNCRIFPGAVIAAIPQDLKFNNEYTTVIIGDNNTIRECVTINRGTSALGRTEIGNNNLLMAYVAYRGKQSEKAAASLKKENAVLKQNAAAAAKAPVKGVTGGGNATEKRDPWLDAFDKDYW